LRMKVQFTSIGPFWYQFPNTATAILTHVQNDKFVMPQQLSIYSCQTSRDTNPIIVRRELPYAVCIIWTFSDT
jgi:hypothetical protein